MKRKSKIMIGLATVLLSALSISLVACASDGSPYGDLNKDGKSIRVLYDFNDGLFQGAKDITLVDTIDLKQYKKDADGNVSVKLLAPDDSRRYESSDGGSVNRTGYCLAGWYQKRELRFSESGEPVDVYGEVLHKGKDEEGNDVLLNDKNEVTEQGYIYDGLWDFNSSCLTLDANAKYPYVKGEYQLTLYAAWVPYFRFDYYTHNANGDWEIYNSTSFDYSAAKDRDSEYADRDMIGVPQWVNGEMNYVTRYANGTTATFPGIEDKTFERAYSDAEGQHHIEKMITHSGNYDKEHGIAIDPVMNIYTEWKDGVWYEIETAEQLFDYGDTNCNYNIRADLDFELEEMPWPSIFALQAFSGKIIGNGHTIKNVTVNQSDIKQTYGGLFAQLTADACITDITFENVKFEMLTGSRTTDACFGLFAGTINESATLENVAVSGQMILDNIFPNDTYSLGLISGNGNNKGISFDNVGLYLCGQKGFDSYNFSIDIDAEGIDQTDGTFEIVTKDYTSTDEIITIKNNK